MRGSKGPLVAVDLRPLQAGYKAHLERGIGRHARGLVRALADIVPKGRIKFFASPGPEPDLDGESVPVEFLLWPRWIERVPAGRETAFRLAGLSSAVRVLDVRVAHFLSHTDAPSAGSAGPGLSSRRTTSYPSSSGRNTPAGTRSATCGRVSARR